MKTLKILAIFLSYPNADTLEGIDKLNEILISENLLSQKTLKRLLNFINDFTDKDLLDTQERYVNTFDRSRSHCLNLFEHIHGESRDRGQAMADLVEIYERKNLFIVKKELPDYLPLFLEYLSLCDAQEIEESLGDVINIVALIGGHLKKNQSPYSVIFSALEELSKTKADKFMVAETISNTPKEAETFEELDELWQEQEVFGKHSSEQKSCNNVALN